MWRWYFAATFLKIPVCGRDVKEENRSDFATEDTESTEIYGITSAEGLPYMTDRNVCPTMIVTVVETPRRGVFTIGGARVE